MVSAQQWSGAGPLARIKGCGFGAMTAVISGWYWRRRRRRSRISFKCLEFYPKFWETSHL